MGQVARTPFALEFIGQRANDFRLTTWARQNDFWPTLLPAVGRVKMQRGILRRVKHSVVIPTSGDPSQSAGLLESLKAGLGNAGLLEVVVVVNGLASQTINTTGLPEIFSHPKIRIVLEPVGSLLAGRHRGVVETSGDVVSFLDDDVSVGEKWCDTLVSAFADCDNLVLAGGPAYPHYDGEVPTWVSELFEDDPQGGSFSPFMSLVDLGDKDIIPVDPNMIWGLNFSIKRSTLLELGGFHPDLLPATEQMFQGDGETGITRKIAAKGLLAGYFSGLAVNHRIPAARMTREFVKKRAFYEGVCEEFDALRKLSGLENEASTNANQPSILIGVLKPIADFSRTRIPDTLIGGNLQKLIHKYRLLGREYLRKHFADHPEVREWITRDKYWDWQHPGLGKK